MAKCINIFPATHMHMHTYVCAHIFNMPHRLYDFIVQLELVNQQLEVSGQEDDEGLVQLKADLTELIGLTQGVYLV